jgi:hypothetical protein
MQNVPLGAGQRMREKVMNPLLEDTDMLMEIQIPVCFRLRKSTVEWIIENL